MSLTLRLFIIAAGCLMEGLVVRDLIKRKMTEKQCLFWLFSGIILILAGAIPQLTFMLATFFGVEYAPSMVFAVGILLSLYGIYRCFVSTAVLSRQTTELVEQISLLQKELETLKEKHDA